LLSSILAYQKAAKVGKAQLAQLNTKMNDNQQQKVLSDVLLLQSDTVVKQRKFRVDDSFVASR